MPRHAQAPRCLMRSVAILGTGRHGGDFADVLAIWFARFLAGIDVRTDSDVHEDASPQERLAIIRGVDAALLPVFGTDVRSSDLNLKLGLCFGCLGPDGIVAPLLVDTDATAI